MSARDAGPAWPAEHHHNALQAAWHAHDAIALAEARQALLQAAYAPRVDAPGVDTRGSDAPTRAALRRLSFAAVALLPRQLRRLGDVTLPAWCPDAPAGATTRPRATTPS